MRIVRWLLLFAVAGLWGPALRAQDETVARPGETAAQDEKALLDYIETRFSGGGAAGDREDEKVLLNRFQVAF